MNRRTSFRVARSVGCRTSFRSARPGNRRTSFRRLGCCAWDKSFFRTERFGGLDHLAAENASFVAFHNEHHRYSAHRGASPDEVWAGRLYQPLSPGYQTPTSLPAKGRIEVVRYVRSNRIVNLLGKTITLAEEHTHQYVTAIIHVRAKQVTVVTLNGEIVHQGDFALSRTLR